MLALDSQVSKSNDFIDKVYDTQKDIIYFSPADRGFPIGFNLLESVNPEYKNIVASGIVGRRGPRGHPARPGLAAPDRSRGDAHDPDDTPQVPWRVELHNKTKIITLNVQFIFSKSLTGESE